jgi:hypothetical protein
MMIRRRPRQSWKHTHWTYRRRALTHYAQTAVAALPIAVGVVTLSLAAAILLLVAGELLLFMLLPRMPGFRKQVDASLERAACMRAALSRAALLGRMDGSYQRELEQLEDLAGRVRGNNTFDNPTTEEWLGLDNLLAVFVRLAIAHRDSASAFPPSGGFELEVQIAELETVHSRSMGEPRAWAERRLAILRDRRDTWCRAREEQAVLAGELSTIGELVRWMYEQSALGRCFDAHCEVQDAVAACSRNGAVLRELAALDGEGPVDPDVLRLGRRAMLDVVAALPTQRTTTSMPLPSVVVAQQTQPTVQVLVAAAQQRAAM